MIPQSSWRIAILLLFLNSFLLVSRILDPLGKHFRAGGYILALLAIPLVLSRRALIFWKSPAGKVLPLLTAWVLLAYFMASRSELSTFYIRGLLQGALLFAAVTGLLTTVSDFKKLFTVLACGGIAACVLGIVWSTTYYGRFALRGLAYSDPNYYAMWLLAVTPIVWVAFARSPLWMKICGSVATAFPLLLALRTTSRGAFVAVLTMLLVVLLLSSMKTRIWIISSSVVALLLALVAVPTPLRSRLLASARLTSIGQGEQGETGSELAAQYSVSARQTLFATSIEMTLNNPLLGVGPGNFGPIVVAAGREQGIDWVILNTHNAYTQISSETGIPGILLFLLLVFFSLKDAISLWRQTGPRALNPDPELHRMAAGLLVSFAAILTCMAFLSEGYNHMVYFYLGLACGLRLVLPEPRDEEEEGEFIETEPGPPALEP